MSLVSQVSDILRSSNLLFWDYLFRRELLVRAVRKGAQLEDVGPSLQGDAFNIILQHFSATVTPATSQTSHCHDWHVCLAGTSQFHVR